MYNCVNDLCLGFAFNSAIKRWLCSFPGLYTKLYYFEHDKLKGWFIVCGVYWLRTQALIQDIWSLHPLHKKTRKRITNKQTDRQTKITQLSGTTGLKISYHSCDWLMLEGVFVVDLRITAELSALTKSIWICVPFCFRNLAVYDVYGNLSFIFHSTLTVFSCIQLDNPLCYRKA